MQSRIRRRIVRSLKIRQRMLIFLEANKLKRIVNYFTKTEIVLWSVSVLLILISFVLFDRENYLTLAASLIGVTSLIFTPRETPSGSC